MLPKQSEDARKLLFARSRTDTRGAVVRGHAVRSRLKAVSVFLSLVLLILGIGFRNWLGKGFHEGNRLEKIGARGFGSASLARPRSGTAVLWSADMETGDLSQWSLPDVAGGPNSGGGVFNSGVATASVDKVTIAHSGLYSAKLFVDTREDPQLATSGTRLFRWREPQEHPELYYRVWYYFPQRYHPNGSPSWWNVFQWKSKHTGATLSDPFFTLNVGNRSDGSMFFYLYDQNSKRTYAQTVKDIPEGRWLRVEAFYRCAADHSGRITFWQDGTPIVEASDVQTRYGDGDCEWSVNNYTDGLDSGSATIYVDDAAICGDERCP
jgi:Polysaccharide lyase